MAKNITRTVEGFEVIYGKINEVFEVEVCGSVELYEVKSEKVKKEFEKLIKGTPDEGTVILRTTPFTKECSIPLEVFMNTCYLQGTIKEL